MDTNMNPEDFVDFDEDDLKDIREADEKGMKERIHKIIVKLNCLKKLCEDGNVPYFFAFYDPRPSTKDSYSYSSLIPEEIRDPGKEITNQYDRFQKFLEIVVDFNLEDYKPVIRNS